MIYHECTVDESNVDVPVKLRYKPKSPFSTSRQDCYGLTVTCRQTRAEFVNLYYSTTQFQIHSRQLAHFHALLSRLSVPSPPAVRAMVGCRCALTCTHLNDFLPILTFQHKHPTTHITVGSSRLRHPPPITTTATNTLSAPAAGMLSDREANMWKILSQNKTPAFLSLVASRQIAALMINNMGRIRMLLRSETAPSWMSRNPSPPAAETIRFAQHLGFPQGITGRDMQLFYTQEAKLEFGVRFG